MNPNATLTVEAERELAEPGLLTDLMTLTKARLSLLVIITTCVGYCLGSKGSFSWLGLVNATFGTALAAGGAGALNQWLEMRVDSLMERTKSRPLPAGRMSPSMALGIGSGLSALGSAWLAVTCNATSAWLAVATVLTYILLYTPLKRRTSLCTIIGAISGAIPPMIGWTAAHPHFELGTWVLFGVLFTWQMPHFLAIAWLYREEYAEAGFVMLRPSDRTGGSTARESLGFTLALVAITMIPFWSGLLTDSYLSGALLLDAGMTGAAVCFLTDRSRATARGLFFASIIFLPLILGLMVVTKA